MSLHSNKIVACTSEDGSHPVRELLDFHAQSRGWQSARWSEYPQALVLQFPDRVMLQQVQVLLAALPLLAALLQRLPVDLDVTVERFLLPLQQLHHVHRGAGMRGVLLARQRRGVQVRVRVRRVVPPALPHVGEVERRVPEGLMESAMSLRFGAARGAP